MKRIGRLLLVTSATAVVITAVFFIFGKISNPYITPAITFEKYFQILLFSFIITSAGLLFGFKKMPKVFALIIHFFALLISFSALFVSFEGFNPMRFFVLIVVFTVFYAAAFALFFGIKTSVLKIDNKIGKKSKDNSNKTEYKSPYV